MRVRFTLLTALACLMVTSLSAQHPQVRKGFWFTGGLGVGSLGCQDCDSRTNGLSGQIGLGGTLSRRVLLGVMSNGWTKTENGVNLNVGTLTAAVRVYPGINSGFFLIGGLGVGTVSASILGYGSGSETGTGALIGVGWDIRVGTNVSVSPYYQGFAMSSNGSDANVGQLGLGITLH